MGCRFFLECFFDSMISSNDFRTGVTIELDGYVWRVVEFLHVKPGKGSAFVRTKLKSVTTGRVIDNTFPSGHKIVDVRVERRKFQYLYKDDMGYNFMNNETYEQISMQEDLIENARFLKEGMIIEVLYHAEKDIPLTVELPANEFYEVTYTEPGIKGDTATNTMKPATLETGAEIRVPLFINIGDSVKVDTTTGDYLGRT